MSFWLLSLSVLSLSLIAVLYWCLFLTTVSLSFCHCCPSNLSISRLSLPHFCLSHLFFPQMKEWWRWRMRNRWRRVRCRWRGRRFWSAAGSGRRVRAETSVCITILQHSAGVYMYTHTHIHTEEGWYISVTCLHNLCVCVCRTFPSCAYGEKCMFIHPNCKYDAKCSKPDCPYTHVSLRAPLQPPKQGRCVRVCLLILHETTCMCVLGNIYTCICIWV